MFRKITISLLSLAFFFVPALLKAQGKSLIWKISGNGLQQESYLFGTIHIIPEADYFLPDGVDSMLLRSKKLVLEMDLSDPSLQLKVMGAMLMDSGRTLKDLYSEKDYAFLVKKLEKNYGLSIDAMGGMKPIMIQQSLMMKKMMGGSYKSYEKEFMAKIADKDIKVVGLETLEDQLNAINAVPVAEQADGLLQAVKNPKEGEKSLEKLIDKYKMQDIEALYSSISEKKEDIGKYEDDLLLNRNKNWIPKIAEMAKKESIFVAVGAAHLGGENGVINLLRKAGFTVEPVLTKN